MARISIYDPPGCCSTGVCDPGLSDSMTQFATAIDSLMKNGHDVARYNMASQPGAFVENPKVKEVLDTDGMEGLPLVLMDNKVVSKGVYLNRLELGQKVGIDIPPSESQSCKEITNTQVVAEPNCCD